MAKYTLDEYDRKVLREARQRITLVRNFHDGAPGAAATVNRLNTIIEKLDFLLKEDADG